MPFSAFRIPTSEFFCMPYAPCLFPHSEFRISTSEFLYMPYAPYLFPTSAFRLPNSYICPMRHAFFRIPHSDFRILLYALCAMPFSDFPPGRRPLWPLWAGGRIPTSEFLYMPHANLNGSRSIFSNRSCLCSAFMICKALVMSLG
jgi:hypothetical protein